MKNRETSEIGGISGNSVEILSETPRSKKEKSPIVYKEDNFVSTRQWKAVVGQRPERLET